MSDSPDPNDDTTTTVIVPSPRINAYVYAVSEDGTQVHVDIQGMALDLVTLCMNNSNIGDGKEKFMAWISDRYDSVSLLPLPPTSSAKH
jgi:hypothetical protein